MKFITSKEGENHTNYLARIVNITEDDFSPHPNPEVTALKRCRIGGDTLYNVIVGINSKPGKYIFFPALSKINSHFLSYCNLFRKPELNKNVNSKPGLFEDNGRVKTIRLKGTIDKKNEETGKVEKEFLTGAVSDGFLIELQTLLNFLIENFNIDIKEDDIESDIWFDTIEHNGKTFWLSKKYIIVNNVFKKETSYNKNKEKYRQKKLKKFNKVIPGQFKFHYDTVIVRKVPFLVQPNDYIHISSKVHGTSLIVSYVLCNQQLTWKQKISKWLTGHNFKQYDYLYASRTVIKNQYDINGNKSIGFYGCDIWGEAFKVIKPILKKGMTIYAEIIGYLPTGAYIQKNYDYGCVRPEEGEEYTYGKHFKINVYRITITNVDGDIHEFSPREVQIWCKNNGLVPVTELYYGKAKDLYPDLNIENHWHENFWDKMSVDKKFYMEMDSPDCNNKVPHEGVVIKIDDMIPRAMKLKCFSFLNKEQADLDKGISNIEDDQSLEEN